MLHYRDIPEYDAESMRLIDREIAYLDPGPVEKTIPEEWVALAREAGMLGLDNQ